MIKNTIDLQEIIDYANCPMIHYFKWVLGQQSDEVSIHDRYAQDILKVMYYFYNRIQSKEPIRTEDIKQMWGKVWVLDKRKSKLLFSDSVVNKDLYSMKRVEGLKTLMKYREYLLEHKCFPLIINYPYIIEVDGIKIKGVIDIVKEVVDENNNREILLCAYIPDTYNLHLEHSYRLKLNADYLGVKAIVGDGVPIKKRIFNLTRRKESIKKVHDIEEQFLKYNLKVIYNQIQNKVYYIQPGVKCKSCIYREHCMNNDNIIDIIK